jgi:predicted nucleic acid-binding protein
MERYHERVNQKTEKAEKGRRYLSYYVDTNIFVYSALAHPIYGNSCKHIVDDIQNQKIKAYSSFLVPIELLGALSRIDIKKAAVAVEAFFSLPINMIQIDEQILQEASEIAVESGASYDSVHAACMRRKKLEIIITEDVTDWKKIKGTKIVRSLEYSQL